LLRLTFRCNQDCSFCWQDRQWPAPPREVFERWLREAHDQGVRRVLFSGGEPTLSPLLVPLVAHAKALGMRVGIQSNAIQLAKPHVRAALLEAGLDFASVSYHSHDAVLSDAMTRAPGTHVRTERGIVAALADGLPVSLNLVLERRNLGTLVDTARHIVARFAPAAPSAAPLTVSISHPNAYFDREQWLETMAPLDEVEPVLRQAVALLQAAGVVVRADGPCGFPLCTLRAVPEAIPPGAIDEIADANLEARGAASACERCALQDACVGPRKTYLEQFGERGLVPFERLPAHFSGA
jgi:pyruvate-formate lyase-activating enzyme